MRKIISLMLIGLMAISISGCAVAMALHGKREVDIASLHIGQPRDEVIMILSQPMKTQTTETGRTDIFECQRGNAPSAGRAIGHGAMDVLTFGAWELIGTPVEALSGSTFYMTISYDKEDKVTKIKTGEEKGSLN